MKTAVTVLRLLASTLGGIYLLSRIPPQYGRAIRWALILVIVAGAAAWLSEATVGPPAGLSGLIASRLVTGAKWAVVAVLAAGLVMVFRVRYTSRKRELQAGYGPGGRRAAVLGLLVAAGYLVFMIAVWARNRSPE